MGHIDHGKSTLLDYIRKSNIVEKEVGGITQRISAYEITHTNSAGNTSLITFIDTPGHEAFVAMRDRGARIADIAILVVSAEDGVKPQTLEALRSIKDAGLPYIVAINKIDKEGANVERTKQNLTENEIYIEGYGGDIPAVAISAKTGKGIPELLDMVMLVTELQELKGNSSENATGFVLETERHKTKGISATLIIKNGTVKTGMVVVAGQSLAPIRILENFKGEKIETATFSSPIRIIGFDSAPAVGIAFTTFSNKKEAEAFQEEAAEKAKEAKKPVAQTAEETRYVIPVLIKADQLGSIDAITHEIAKIKHDRVVFKVISTGIGPISENDIKAAITKEHTVIIGFNIDADGAAKGLADRFELKIEIFNIIYKVTEYLEKVASEQAPRIQMEEKTGTAKILKLFSRMKDKQVLGARVEQGVIALDEEVKILRRDTEIGRGRIRELQQMKTKASEVTEGNECGAMIESKIEIAPGDKIECFKVVEK